MEKSVVTDSAAQKPRLIDRIRNLKIVNAISQIKHIRLLVCVLILAVVLLAVAWRTGESKQESSTAAVVSTQMNTVEARLADTLSKIDGVGNVSVMISYQNENSLFSSGEITGVIVVADGAKNISVLLKLEQAAAAALGVDKSKVSVFASK